MPDDYGRKNYQDRQYRDWLKTKTAKSVWNQILERHPGQGEFSRTRGTSLSRAVQRYIKQSEFKKPYRDNDFVNMEQEWEGPGNGLPIGGFDVPWGLTNPVAVGPITSVFDAELDGGWCKEYPTSIIISGTHPITLLTITFGGGATLSDISGYGTNEVMATLEVPDDYAGMVTIEASMITSEGVSGDSNVNVFENSSCCDYETEEDDYTVAPTWYSVGKTGTPDADPDVVFASAITSPADLVLDRIAVGDCGDVIFDGSPYTGQSTIALFRFPEPSSEVHVAEFHVFSQELSIATDDTTMVITAWNASSWPPLVSEYESWSDRLSPNWVVHGSSSTWTESSVKLNSNGIDYINSGGQYILCVMSIYHFNGEAPPASAFGDPRYRPNLSNESARDQRAYMKMTC